MDGHTPLLSDDGVGIHEAKTTLSKLVARVEAGEEVVIKRGGVPVAKLVAITPEPPKFGFLKTTTKAPEAFFDPLPAEWLGLAPGA